MSLFVGKSAFRPHNADFLSDIPSFAESTRISLAESETVARPFRRILLPQSRSLYSLHIRASANTTSLLRYALIYLENGIGKNKRHERNLTYLRPEIMADRRRTDDNKGAREVVLLLNIGSPDSPEVKDVARYLNSFLTDRRIITLPFLLRQLLVIGIITPF